ncbi:hypothetical protein [Pelagibacterium sp. H642]|uniref:hypothetical protein n=1 Tax=Pelagibacterium sp. H642 TaxID=1881069 RepID=UPI0028162AB4|nr:hypothetical protein [Pelagibacterium sp. H642]WMT90179.1 hypothetical protein NO934_15480 [Pelagibacterium sp. H642]
MLTGIFTAIKTNAALGWIVRRIFDWGGWLAGILGGLLTLFLQLDTLTQSAIITVLQGNWQEVTLGSAFGFAVLAINQWRSWRATVRPQVVTSDKKKIEVPVLTEEQARAITGYEGPIADRSKS